MGGASAAVPQPRRPRLSVGHHVPYATQWLREEASGRDAVPLDDLVSVIETLKARLETHRQVLQANETRTRMALIDPLLQALGWDTADPALVLPEYDLSGNRADYALLDGTATPVAFVEAKHLGMALASHREQIVRYAVLSGVPYAGLTDGDHWELYRAFNQSPSDRSSLEDRLLLNVSIADRPAHEVALKLLLIWQPNLAAGDPVEANEPVLATPTESVTPRPVAGSEVEEPQAPTSAPGSEPPPMGSGLGAAVRGGFRYREVSSNSSLVSWREYPRDKVLVGVAGIHSRMVVGERTAYGKQHPGQVDRTNAHRQHRWQATIGKTVYSSATD